MFSISQVGRKCNIRAEKSLSDNILRTIKKMNGEGKESVFLRGWRRGRAAWRVFSSHRATTVAGTLVFFLIMSLVPCVFWLTLLFGGSKTLLDHLLSLELFGWARDFIGFLQANAQGATAGASVFLIATTLWSGSSFFYHLRRSGEIVYGERRLMRGWKVRIAAIAMTLVLLLAAAAAGAAFVALGVFARFFPKWLYYLLQYAAVLALGFLLAWGLNLYVCPRRGCAKTLAAGSALTAAAWLAASAAFNVYAMFSAPERLYGALALVIVFLLWLYWLMICFVAGVIFNKHRVFARRLRTERPGKKNA